MRWHCCNIINNEGDDMAVIYQIYEGDDMAVIY